MDHYRLVHTAKTNYTRYLFVVLENLQIKVVAPVSQYAVEDKMCANLQGTYIGAYAYKYIGYETANW
jgi:hypothetical protein